MANWRDALDDTTGRRSIVAIQYVSQLPLGVRDVHELVLCYVKLETSVRRIIEYLCSPVCAACPACCCREEICRENLGSPWLTLVSNQVGHDLRDYHPFNGWLGSHGCRLRAGRPPVCYEFICSRLRLSIPLKDRLHEFAPVLKILSIVGRRAIGSQHLVTISRGELAEKLNSRRLGKRIEECIRRVNDLDRRLGRVQSLPGVPGQ